MQLYSSSPKYITAQLGTEITLYLGFGSGKESQELFYYGGELNQNNFQL